MTTVTPLERQTLRNINLSVAVQLRIAADFIKSTPGVKASPFAVASVSFFAASPAEVDEVAAAARIKPAWDVRRTAYSASLSFGPEVEYRVTHVCKQSGCGNCGQREPGTGRAA